MTAKSHATCKSQLYRAMISCKLPPRRRVPKALALRCGGVEGREASRQEGAARQASQLGAAYVSRWAQCWYCTIVRFYFFETTTNTLSCWSTLPFWSSRQRGHVHRSLRTEGTMLGWLEKIPGYESLIHIAKATQAKGVTHIGIKLTIT